MEKKTALKAAAASAALAGSLLVIAPAASAASCPSGQVAIAGGCGTVVGTLPDQSHGTTGSVVPEVGVDFRDEHGHRTGSGLSNQDQFRYLDQKKDGLNGDGTLIKVRQTTKGKGGWGELYEGWIPVKYTQLPKMFT